MSPFVILAACMLAIDFTLVWLFHMAYGEKRQKLSRERLLQVIRQAGR